MRQFDMSGQTDLTQLFSSLKLLVSEDVFVFAHCVPEQVPRNLSSIMRFEEAEGTTLILAKEDAEQSGINHEFECKMITLNVHSSLEAVGFMAKIASKLAEHQIPVNPVAGFYHDHLFVPVALVEKATHLLEEMAENTSS